MKTNSTQTAQKTLILFFPIVLCIISLYGQSLSAPKANEIELLQQDFKKISNFFEDAYRQNPTVPRGILEAISYQYRRFSTEEIYNEEYDDTHSIPRTYTVMGLTLNGKGVFRENLKLVDSLSSFSADEILQDNRKAVLAYAEAFAALQKRRECFSEDISKYKDILIKLSELPYQEDSKNWEYNYPINSFLYEIYRFLADSNMIHFSHRIWDVDFEKLFGEDIDKLRQHYIDISDKESNSNTDYSGANWIAAPSCNYTQGRNGATITGVTIHYTQGTYSGALAWFQNCNAHASAHYIIRSSDGQITQMVREQDKAWHVGSANSYTIGIEHEAYGNIASFFTEAMYQASAALVRDICLRRPNISTQRTFYRDTLDDGTVLNAGLHSLGGSTACTQIRGHQHYPNQTHTDPGPFWDWNHYYHLLNTSTNIITDTNLTGVFYDSGGASNDYGTNEHQFFLIQHPNADSITLDFTSFDLETNYDFLWIYDGDNPSAPRLGRWNSYSPGHIRSSGPALLVEFRSDCATQNSGWMANWNCHTSPSVLSDTIPPTTHILHDTSVWVNRNFTLKFKDTDNTHIKYRFWQITERDNSQWYGNPFNGFLHEDFNTYLDSSVWEHNGNWQINNQQLTYASSQGYAQLFTLHDDTKADCYLYEFLLNIPNDNCCSFFFHLQKNVSAPWNGYELRIDKIQQKVSLYMITNGVTTMLKSVSKVSFPNGSQQYRILWDTSHLHVYLFRQQSLLFDCVTASTGTEGGNRFVGFSSNGPIIIDNLHAYAGRDTSIIVSVGSNDTCLMRTQAFNGEPNCKIKSIVIDENFNFSNVEESSVKVDYTAPPTPTRIEASALTVHSNRLSGIPIYGQWDNMVDGQSGLSNYEYTLYITTGHNTCLRRSWESTNLTHTATGLQIPLQSTSCKIGVRSIDNAGNYSRVAFSNDLLFP
ncbi:MAG: N-acetylmuramoyl-L-alanine amidase [Bacteroidales bacterium]|nr:N-acetylmuramoyl-L-alanine amidase [Bacteroidales bacterium]